MKYKSLAIMLGILGTVRGKELTASCPLHSERNPSFSMNVDTGLWQCFSRCGGGNFTQLVERKLGYTHQEAERWIESNGQGNSVTVLKESLDKIFDPVVGLSAPGEVLHWRESYLLHNRNTMPLWLLNRGFTWETINHWQMVYDVGSDAVIFPVFWQGEWVGTVTRNTNPAYPKYVNSPDLPVEKIFFGEISSSHRDIIICEGVLDVIWLWQLGFHAVSVLGANLTLEQIKILKAYQFGEITLAFDNDERGKKAHSETVEKLVNAGLFRWQLRQVVFPGRSKEDPSYRKDPQECSVAEFGNLYENRRVVF
jgi:DNA primase